MTPIPYARFSALRKDGRLTNMRVDAFGYVHGDLDGLAVFARVHSLIGPDEASNADKPEKLS